MKIKLHDAIILACEKYGYTDVKGQVEKSVYIFTDGIATPEKRKYRRKNQ